jgi:L-lactate dehydrogenase complex protein LldG
VTEQAGLVELFVANLKRNGFRVHYRVASPIEDARTSEALYALADPGSVVLAASPDEPRARSLLPDVHITSVTEDRVLADLDALFAALGSDLPSSLAIVSGPSRSGDIEQVLSLGVHGPREEHVVLLPASGA